MSAAPITYLPNFVPDHEAVFARLAADLAWVKREDAPRQEYWTNRFERPYTYGRGQGERTYAAQPPHEIIQGLAGRLAAEHGFDPEGCFLNLYGTKRDWLGWHEDDDPGINHNKPIAVITVGQGRVIEFRERLTRGETPRQDTFGPVQGLMLESGSLLLMHAGMQSTHQHRIPKASFEAKPRISLTYRGLIA